VIFVVAPSIPLFVLGVYFICFHVLVHAQSCISFAPYRILLFVPLSFIPCIIYSISVLSSISILDAMSNIL